MYGYLTHSSTIAYAFLALSPPPYQLLNGLGSPAVTTAFYALNAALTILATLVAFVGRLTFLKFACAFAMSNGLTAITYQAYGEAVVWRCSLVNTSRSAFSPSKPNTVTKVATTR